MKSKLKLKGYWNPIQLLLNVSPAHQDRFPLHLVYRKTFQMHALTFLIISLSFCCKYYPSSPNHPYEEAVQAIENGDFGNVHSLVVQKDGHVVFEKYFNGWTRDSLHQL